MADDQGSAKSESAVPTIGSYKLVQQLGSGGMSSVFRAIHAETGHEVAVKVLPRYLAKNPTLLQRFLREAKSAEALEHPNIVSIYDRGSEQGRYYLVLEYVAGGDLHDRVRNHGALAISEAVDVIKAVCRGLNHAASRGLIHRDIKPANLLVTADGKVKIIDLGLALQVEDEDERVTRDGTTVGTVDYMAPEQARDSRATSVRSDIYSLGCTFYYLLTGSPPYPGGDVSEKLRRHAAGPVPDLRALRPEAPEGLARIVHKMMAKRPEKRFADYDQLLAALDAVSLQPSAPAAEPLYALIDDEDEDEAQPGAYTLAGAPGKRPSSTAEPAPVRQSRKAPTSSHTGATLGDLAAIDEGKPPAARSGRRAPPPVETTRPTALIDDEDEGGTLADLAALDDDVQPSARSGVRRPPSTAQAAPLEAVIDEDDDHVSYSVAGQSYGVARPGHDPSVREWILRGLMIGIAIVLVGVGIQQLIVYSTAPSETAKERAAPESTEAPEPPETVVASVPKPVPKPAKINKQLEEPRPTERWIEPADEDRELPAESPLAPAQESRFVPAWAKENNAGRGDGQVVTVRRLEPAPSAEKAPSVALAMQSRATTIELADNGPFFERDLQPFVRPRVIRARPGFRPMIVFESPSKEFHRSQTALVHVDGEGDLTLEGIDLVFRATDPNRPPHLNALFLCRGGSLTLRDCTVSVISDADDPITCVRVGESGGTSAGRVPHVRMERTLVRGSALTAVQLSDGPGEVFLAHSAFLCGDAPALMISGGGVPGSLKSARRIHLVRNVVAARKPVLGMSISAAGPAGGPPVVRALECFFARVEGARPPALVELKEDATAAPRTLLDWLGVDNTMTGWSAWLAAGPSHDVKVAGIVEAHEAWTGSDEETQVLPSAWPQAFAESWASADELARHAPAMATTIRRIAAPTPLLWEKTLGALARLVVPDRLPPVPATRAQPGSAHFIDDGGRKPISRRVPMPSKNAAPAVEVFPGGQVRGGPGAAGPQFAKPGTPGEKPAPPPLTPVPGVKDLTFDVDIAPWNGDLGQFLRETVTGAEPRLRVQAWGSGEHTMTPVRLPTGTAVEIQVITFPAGSSPLGWIAAPSAAGEALLDASGADLTLIGVQLARNGGSRLKSLIRVEDGRLALDNCRLQAPWNVETGGGRLIHFRAATTRVLPPIRGENAAGSAQELPVARLRDCILVTGGDAVTAELGLGVVALDNCAVASGLSAFVLLPQAVSRKRFAADLWLDRCNVLTDGDVVRVGPWRGKEPGPDRPWLMSTSQSAFLSAHAGTRTSRQAVLLRIDPAALAQGTAFWQADRDAFDVAHFLTGDGASALADRKTDTQRDWIDFWGRSHALNVWGPSRTDPGASGISLAKRPQSGAMTPANFAINKVAGRARYAGADLSRLGIVPPAPPPRGGRRP
jgi:serine/threonine-protein kinase